MGHLDHLDQQGHQELVMMVVQVLQDHLDPRGPFQDHIVPIIVSVFFHKKRKKKDTSLLGKKTNSDLQVLTCKSELFTGSHILILLNALYWLNTGDKLHFCFYFFFLIYVSCQCPWSSWPTWATWSSWTILWSEYYH